MKVPFNGKNIRLVGKRVPKSKSDKYAVDFNSMSDDTEPVVSPECAATPSVVSTNSDSSGTGHEVAFDWSTANVAEPEPEPEPLKKERTRSFRDKLFRGRSRSFSLKADRKLDFSLIESPIKSPTPVVLPYDASVTSESSFGDSQQESQQEDTNNAALGVQSRSVKKLAPPKPFAQFPVPNKCPSTNPFDDNDPYLPVEEAEASGDEETAASDKDTQSSYSIPMSYFLKKTSSWGVSSKRPKSVNDEISEDEIVLQERHWGKEVRSRSRDSTSWVPTEEERYKIARAFIYGEEEAKDDDESTEVSAFTSNVSTATGMATEFTGDTGATGESVPTEVTEYTNETTSAHTGKSDDDSSSSESISTTISYVTGATGETSMFSLGVDESSRSTEEVPRRRQPKRKRRLVESERNILVEVFADIRLLAEDLADEEQGCRACFVCA